MASNVTFSFTKAFELDDLSILSLQSVSVSGADSAHQCAVTDKPIALATNISHYR